MERDERLRAHSEAHRLSAPNSQRATSDRVWHLRGAGYGWGEIAGALRITESQARYAWQVDK